MLLCFYACREQEEPQPEPEPLPDFTPLEQNACFVVHLDQPIGGDGRLLAPNIFTPDKDGINDIFGITLTAPDSIKETFSMRVINDSLGDVFIGQTLEDSWDGTLPNGEPAPEGVYSFNVNLILDNTFISFNSQVTLLRVFGINANTYTLQRCRRCVFGDEIDPVNGAVNETVQPLENICP